jgi:Coenzyme PQQ synthesis protein D (PqqD)
MIPQRGSRIVRSPRVVIAKRGDEAVLLDVERGRRFAFNSLSARIWAILASEPTLSELVERLWTEYDVPAAPLAHDVAVLLVRWNDDELIRWR